MATWATLGSSDARHPSGPLGSPAMLRTAAALAAAASAVLCLLFLYPPPAEAQSANEDFNTLNAANNNDPYGIWSNGETMWVADYIDDKIYAYSMSTKQRVSSKDFNTLNAANNNSPGGIWSNDETMWVADPQDDKIYAYSMSTKQRVSSKDFNTLNAASNNSPGGIWSNGETMWVTDAFDDKIYAYSMSTKQRVSSKDFNTLNAAGNRNPTGIWSDGEFMWVADFDDVKLYAYDIITKQRVPCLDFQVPDAQADLNGVWSDGNTFWIADIENDKIHSVRLGCAQLTSLSLSGSTVAGSIPVGVTMSPAFDSDTFDYLGFADIGPAFNVGVRATALHNGATVVVKNNGVVDADAAVPYDRSSAPQVITVEVTAQDGVTSQTFRVEMAPKAHLVLADDSIPEDGGSTTLRAYLSKASSRSTTINVRTIARRLATLTPHGHARGTSLYIPAGASESTRCCLSLAAVDNDRLHGDQRLTIRGSVADNPEVYGPDNVFLTIIDDDRPIPDTPANFEVTSEAGKTTFSWDDVAVPRLAKSVRYDVFVREPGGSDDDWVFLAHTGIFEGTTHNSPLTDQRLPVGETYEFALRAMSITRSPGNTGSPHLGDLTAPVTHTVAGPNRPRNLAAERTVNVASGPVRLAWQPPALYPVRAYLPSVMPVPDPDNDPGTVTVDATVTGYTILRAEEPADDNDVLTGPDHGAVYSELATVGNVLTYTDTTASDDQSYFYRVQAISPDGTSETSRYGFVYGVPSNSDVFDFGRVLDVPPYPVNLRTAVTAQSVALVWDEVALADSYVVFRRSPGTGHYVQEATTTSTSYTDTDVVVGRTYGYVVKAVNGNGASLPSGAVEITVPHPPPPLVPPSSPPTGLGAVVGVGSVTLSWTASDDDTVTGYDVFRQLRDADPPEDAVFVASVDAATTSVTDTGVQAGVSYTYSVVAVNFDGASEPATVDVDITDSSGPRNAGPPPAQAGPLTGFTLVDASNQNVLAALTAGATVALADPNGGSYAIRANLADGETAGSVSLALSGAKAVSRTENIAPYSLYGDGGANALYGGALPAGSYTLTATAYAGHNLSGDELGTLQVAFTVTAVVEPNTGPLTGFTFVDASNQNVLAALTGGATVALADPNGGSYAIRANLANGETAGSVRLELSGAKTVSRTENIAPYSLYGDGGANALHGQALPAGSYTLTATAYAERNLGGDELGTLEVSFTITAGN